MASAEKHQFLEGQWTAICDSQVDFTELCAAADELAEARKTAVAAEIRFAAAIKNLGSHFNTSMCEFLSPLGEAIDSNAQAHSTFVTAFHTAVQNRVFHTIKPHETKKLIKDMKKIKSTSSKKHDAVEKAHATWKKQKKPKNAEKKKRKYDEVFRETEIWLDKEVNQIKYSNEMRYKGLGNALSTLIQTQKKYIDHCAQSFSSLPSSALKSKNARLRIPYQSDDQASDFDDDISENNTPSGDDEVPPPPPDQDASLSYQNSAHSIQPPPDQPATFRSTHTMQAPGSTATLHSSPRPTDDLASTPLLSHRSSYSPAVHNSRQTIRLPQAVPQAVPQYSPEGDAPPPPPASESQLSYDVGQPPHESGQPAYESNQQVYESNQQVYESAQPPQPPIDQPPIDQPPIDQPPQPPIDQPPYEIEQNADPYEMGQPQYSSQFENDQSAYESAPPPPPQDDDDSPPPPPPM